MFADRLANPKSSLLQFTATGQAKDENRLLSAGWLWQGNWAGSNRSGCAHDSCGTMGTGFSLVRDLRKRDISSSVRAFGASLTSEDG